MYRKVSQIGSLVRYEKLDEDKLKAMSDAEKKQNAISDTSMLRRISGTLFNISHYVKIIYSTCEQLKSFQSLQCLTQMMTEAEKSIEKPQLEDLRRIVYELQEQFRTTDSNYFKAKQGQNEEASIMQIDTTANKAKNLFEIQIDHEKVGSHLQAYFSCFLLLFKELS